jgi:hypothetical protein
MRGFAHHAPSLFIDHEQPFLFIHYGGQRPNSFGCLLFAMFLCIWRKIKSDWHISLERPCSFMRWVLPGLSPRLSGRS